MGRSLWNADGRIADDHFSDVQRDADVILATQLNHERIWPAPCWELAGYVAMVMVPLFLGWVFEGFLAAVSL